MHFSKFGKNNSENMEDTKHIFKGEEMRIKLNFNQDKRENYNDNNESDYVPFAVDSNQPLLV